MLDIGHAVLHPLVDSDLTMLATSCNESKAATYTVHTGLLRSMLAIQLEREILLMSLEI